MSLYLKKLFIENLNLAKGGNKRSQFIIGSMYELGIGTNQNYNEAIKWYIKAAKRGHSMASNNIGVFYNNGYGVNINHKKALKWFLKAAKSGNVKAQATLSIIYCFGEEIKTNYVQAYKWATLANLKGFKLAKKQMLILEKKMTVDQILKAKKLAQESYDITTGISKIIQSK